MNDVKWTEIDGIMWVSGLESKWVGEWGVDTVVSGMGGIENGGEGEVTCKIDFFYV